MRAWTTAATLAAGVLAALAPAAPAWAHNQLIDADPAPDAVLTTAPFEVELTFAEPLDPTYTVIVVTDADAEAVPTTDPEVDGTRGTVTFTAPPGSGVYTVTFRVVSDDGHPVQGSYEFTVAGEAGRPPEGGTAADDAVIPDVEGEAAPAPAPGAGAGAVATVVGGLVLLATATAGMLWWRRRRAGA